jgi:hypothetical protein|uniref:Uncharacterized protein n=1 Tax=Attheya septentrionalis TaxID=420275 RepID=A0A6T7JUD8_9STRA|mmetsp:Transcript_3936/g.7081  ORF Transcript_3936/g.7081 Transcript_3936/m.7081 type:complete len:208 (+) Transcript_3936:262-885(+)
MFGLVVPGSPVMTQFVASDATGNRFTLQLPPITVATATASIPDVVFFFLPDAPIPPSHGAMLYWQATTSCTTNHNNTISTGFELLGSISPSSPSAVLRTGWGMNESFLQFGSTGGESVTITFGVSVEPLDHIDNISSTKTQSNRIDDRLFVATSVAKDLFQYMQSFDDGQRSSKDYMTVPVTIFTQWMERFERRFRLDPNFFLKKKD